MTLLKIAVLWCGHARTAFRALDSHEAMVMVPNSSQYQLENFVHMYDVISDSGWSDTRRWINPMQGVELNEAYIEAIKKRLKPIAFTSCRPHPEDLDAAKRAAATAGHGNIPAATHQLLKRSRAWKDMHHLLMDNEYTGILVTRFDNKYSSPIVFPDPSTLREKMYYSAWIDNRPKAVDDRFALLTPGTEDFLENWGLDACEYVAAQTGHFLPEESTGYALAKRGVIVAALCAADPIKIDRFGNSDLGELRCFVERSRGQ